jgi:hypothetical protein
LMMLRWCIYWLLCAICWLHLNCLMNCFLGTLCATCQYM